MNTYNTIRNWGMNFFFLFLIQFTATAQTDGIFSLPFNGEEVFVTQEINPIFLGVYNGKQARYTLSKHAGTSTMSSKGKNAEIVWGILTTAEIPVITRVTEFVNGKAITYEAWIVIVYNTEENSSEEILMYEYEGHNFFGNAEQIGVPVASNK